MTTLILLSGGVGSRMQNSIPKQYMLLAGKPIITHILERCDKIREIEKVVVVCADEYVSHVKLMVKQYDIRVPIEYAQAGKTRQASVFSGLKKVKTDSVIIHEAARPFVSVEDFEAIINAPEENVIYGLAIPFTVLKGREYVAELLKRSELVNVQLPQKFSTELLLEAHEKAFEEGEQFTEDASQIYYYRPDIKIRIMDGKEYNIKITTPTDLMTGELIYKEHFARRR